ncbi:hypothetical protein ACFYSH_32905 [Streptomyces sp. NPDC005791]
MSALRRPGNPATRVVTLTVAGLAAAVTGFLVPGDDGCAGRTVAP